MTTGSSGPAISYDATLEQRTQATARMIAEAPRRSAVIRRRRQVQLLWLVALGLGIGAYMWWRHGPVAFVLHLVVGTLILAHWRRPRRGRRMVALARAIAIEQSGEGDVPTEVSVEPEGVAIATPDAAWTCDWPSVGEVRTVDGDVELWSRDGGLHLMPATAFASDADRLVFVTAVERGIASAEPAGPGFAPAG